MILSFRIVLLFVILFLLWRESGRLMAESKQLQENLMECTSCDSYMEDNGSSYLLNPLVWPFSGTRAVDDIRVLEADRGVTPNSFVQIAQASVPDHASKTN